MWHFKLKTVSQWRESRENGLRWQIDKIAWILMSLPRREMSLVLENASLHLHSLAYLENIIQCIYPTQLTVSTACHCVNIPEGKCMFEKFSSNQGGSRKSFSILWFFYFWYWFDSFKLFLTDIYLVASSWHISMLNYGGEKTLSNTLNKCLWFNQLKFLSDLFYSDVKFQVQNQTRQDDIDEMP